jgi:serine/threonine protein phosphatase PrpC
MLASALEQQPQPWDYDKVLDAFTTTCRRIDDECPPPHSAGTTLSGALRLGDMLYVAKVGDSATFVANYTAEEGVRIMFETTPHKPDDLVERFRIEQLGGIIKLPDPGPRQSAIIVLGGEMAHLAMSRSLGDRNASSVGVIPDPDVAAFDLSKFQGTKLFVVSVTDGLFDVMSMQDIANEIARRLYVCEGSSSNNSLKEGCEYLVDRAYDTWQQLYSTYAAGDDMTIAVHEL